MSASSTNTMQITDYTRFSTMRPPQKLGLPNCERRILPQELYGDDCTSDYFSLRQCILFTTLLAFALLSVIIFPTCHLSSLNGLFDGCSTTNCHRYFCSTLQEKYINVYFLTSCILYLHLLTQCMIFERLQN